MAMLGQPGIGLAEGTGAEKAAVGGQRTGVRGLQNQVLGAVDVVGQAACLLAPEQEHAGAGQVAQPRENRGSQGLPADAAVAARRVRGHGQNLVEQEDALRGPGGEEVRGIQRGRRVGGRNGVGQVGTAICGFGMPTPPKRPGCAKCGPSRPTKARSTGSSPRPRPSGPPAGTRR